MPTYEYRCKKGHEFEAFQKMSDPPLTECPECGAAAERRISAGTGLVFKGSGFYITDYKRADEKKAREKKKAGEADSAGKAKKKDASGSGASEGGSGSVASASGDSGGGGNGSSGKGGRTSRGPGTSD